MDETIGRYQLLKEIGHGGMADVYLAYDPRFERQVAIKVLPPEYLKRNPSMNARFTREARAIAKLEHPAIVPVHDFGEENDQLFLVMRYMPGGSLADRLNEGPLPVPQVLQIIQRVASALEEAHRQGIIHRDLKPGNILFDAQDRAYLGDFGIAKLQEGTTDLTGSAIIGTPAYMSPEQAKGEQLDGRTDVYSLGIILFQMLTGEQPYQADTPLAVLFKHVSDPIPRLNQVKEDLPPAFDTVVQKALAKEPESRYATPTEITQALRWVAKDARLDINAVDDEETLEPVESTPLPKPASEIGTYQFSTSVPTEVDKPVPVVVEEAPKKRKRRFGWVIGILLILLVLCGGTIGVWARLNWNRVDVDLINQNCYPQDLYLDGEKVAFVDAHQNTTFSTSWGFHRVQACYAGGTNNCGDIIGQTFSPLSLEWTIYADATCE